MQKSLLLRWWWTTAFVMICLILLEQGSSSIQQEQKWLQMSLEQLEQERVNLLAERDELSAKINSHSDPLWLELILMKDLGVVPKGYTKAFFYPLER